MPRFQVKNLWPFNATDGTPVVAGRLRKKYKLQSHVIDWFRAICGDGKEVTALYGPQHDERYGFPDILHAIFRFKSGALATITGGRSSPLHKFRESQGPLAECGKGGFKMVPHLDHIDLYWQRLDEEEAHHERFDDLGFDHAYRMETRDFVEWVQHDKQPCLTWEEAIRCVEMMEAAYRSAESGGRPVKLPSIQTSKTDRPYCLLTKSLSPGIRDPSRWEQSPEFLGRRPSIFSFPPSTCLRVRESVPET